MRGTTFLMLVTVNLGWNGVFSESKDSPGATMFNEKDVGEEEGSDG